MQPRCGPVLVTLRKWRFNCLQLVTNRHLTFSKWPVKVFVCDTKISRSSHSKDSAFVPQINLSIRVPKADTLPTEVSQHFF